MRTLIYPLKTESFISLKFHEFCIPPPTVSTKCDIMFVTNVVLCLLDQHITPVTFLKFPLVFLKLLLFGLWWLHLLVKFSHHVACRVVVCDNHSSVSCLFVVSLEGYSYLNRILPHNLRKMSWEELNNFTGLILQGTLHTSVQKLFVVMLSPLFVKIQQIRIFSSDIFPLMHMVVIPFTLSYLKLILI